MKKVLLTLALLFASASAHAQDALVVTTCGTLPLAYTAGATRQPTVDVNGNTCTGNANGSGATTIAPSASATVALSRAVSATAGVTSLLAKSTAGNMYGYNCTAITGGAAGYCVAYDSATVPGTGALTAASVKDFCYIDSSARGCSLSYIPMGSAHGSGVVILLTSAATPFTYTTGVLTGAISAAYK